MSKLERRVGYLWLILTILILLNIGALVFQLITNREVYPVVGPQGIAGLHGDKGDPGDKGDRGSMGPTGPQGPQGNQGPPGSQGSTGSQGSPGEPGRDGADGQDGAQGEPGRNGREIEMRHNDEADRTEWRYAGDENWQILFRDCEINDTCEIEDAQ